MKNCCHFLQTNSQFENISSLSKNSTNINSPIQYSPGESRIWSKASVIMTQEMIYSESYFFLSKCQISVISVRLFSFLHWLPAGLLAEQSKIIKRNLVFRNKICKILWLSLFLTQTEPFCWDSWVVIFFCFVYF